MVTFSFNFYRQASSSCTNVFKHCHENEWYKVLLCGISELAEIASLRAKEENIEIVGVFDSQNTTKEFLGLPVWSSMDLLPDFDVCVITNVEDPSGLFNYLSSNVANEQILAPDVLGINVTIEAE